MKYSTLTKLSAGLTLAFIVLIVPVSAHAATANFFGPIVPTECNCDGVPGHTSAASYGCVLATTQNVINLMISLGCIFATLALVYAGFIWMFNGSNAEARSKGRGMFINVMIGLAIVLAAWLIVDYIMKKLYKPNASDGTASGSTFGPWNSILADNGEDMCISETTPQRIQGLFGSITNGIVGSTDAGSLTGPGGGTGGPGPGGGGGSCTAIPESQLVPFPSSADIGSHRDLADTVQRFVSMRTAALREGVDLRVSSGYRSPDDQTAAWNNNGCRLVNGSAVCSTRTAAVPCSLGGNGSNHTSGTAVDIRLGPGAYTWLRAHAGQYGFYNQLPNDPPHWSASGR